MISGPLGPSFLGEWQSSQPMELTRYAPSFTRLSCDMITSPAEACVLLLQETMALSEATTTPIAKMKVNFFMFYLWFLFYYMPNTQPARRLINPAIFKAWRTL